MAKEMNVNCDFLANHLTCELPEHTMDVMLKVQTRMGGHTFREDAYLKYRRWNNELRPFQKQNSLSDNSRGTSTQTIINNVEDEGEENKSVSTDSDRNSVHSNWSKLVSVDEEVEYTKLRSGLNIGASTSNASSGEAMKKLLIPPRKKAVKNIILIPYKPKPTDCGSWRIKSPYATSTIASPPLASNNQRKDDEMVYVPHSPYYSPVHPPEFYEDE